jgi:hypothetical protein
VVHVLRAALKTAVEDTHKGVLVQLGGQLKYLVLLEGNSGDLLDAKLRQLQAQMTELKRALGHSRGVVFLEDHTQRKRSRRRCRLTPG